MTPFKKGVLLYMFSSLAFGVYVWTKVIPKLTTDVMREHRSAGIDKLRES